MPNDRVDGEWQVLGVSYRSLVKPDWQQAAYSRPISGLICGVVIHPVSADERTPSARSGPINNCP